MTKIKNASITDFMRAARAAHDGAEAQRAEARGHERITQIMNIGKHLAEHGIEPVGDPFTNSASGRVCVPIAHGGWDEENETYVHTVAAEWDSEAPDLGMPLVADGDFDDYGWNPERLFPAGRLVDLVDVGRAIANGGRPYMAAPTARDRVRRAIGSVTADYAGPNAEAILAAADAVCEAILNVADAIREARS